MSRGAAVAQTTLPVAGLRLHCKIQLATAMPVCLLEAHQQFIAALDGPVECFLRGIRG